MDERADLLVLPAHEPDCNLSAFGLKFVSRLWKEQANNASGHALPDNQQPRCKRVARLVSKERGVPNLE